MKNRPNTLRAAALLAAAFLTTLPAAGQAGWQCRALESPPALTGFLESEDLSGIARCGTHVLVASDEGANLQLGNISADGIRYTANVPLVPAGSTSPGSGEIDMEGVCYAANERAFYVTGSHGVGKKKGDFQLARYGVYRIPFDAEKGGVQADAITQSSLLPWLDGSAEFKDHIRRPLQRNGFNIEGIAHADGRLFFGVRGPALAGHGWIIEVEAASLFTAEGSDAKATAHRIPLGVDRGIREIVKIEGGFLLLTGNAGAEPSKKFRESTARKPDAAFGLVFVPWAGTGPLGQPVDVADVSAPDGKAEGLLVLEETARTVQVLVLHDGLEQGGASGYVLERPAAVRESAAAR